MDSYCSYQVINGLKFPKEFNRKNIEYALRYEAKPEDKFVVTYPKNGTTWTQQMINLIANDGVIDKLTFSSDSFLEISGENTIKWPAIKTHLPFEALPLHPSAKYLLVFRNPKDSCVSFYYHTVATDPDFEGDFHDFFDLWVKGLIPYGNYFDNTLEYWNHRLDPNFQFLIYEDMKRHPRETVLKIAKFLGQEFVDKLKGNEELFTKIVENSTIDSLRSGYTKNDLGQFTYLTRKGEVGDWRNHLTEEESDIIDDKVDKVFANTNLRLLWTQIMEW